MRLRRPPIGSAAFQRKDFMGLSFFTALAPDEQIQGSRDPLGLLPIWSRLGRCLIGNVTTISGDLRGWTSLIVMVGLYAERLEQGSIEESDTEPLFRAEQLIAYSRHLHPGGQEPGFQVRGLNLVKRRLNESAGGSKSIPLGLATDRRILTAQESAGVLGQIGSPAIASGLLSKSRFTLTPAGQALWSEVYRPKLRPYESQITALLGGKRGFAPTKADEPLAMTLAKIHALKLTESERIAYRTHVLQCNKGADAAQSRFLELCLQPQIAEALGEPLTIPSTLHLAKAASGRGHQDTSLALRNIVAAEKLLSPMERLFGWVQSRHGQAIADVVREVNFAWGGALKDVAEGTGLVNAQIADIYKDQSIIGSVTECSEALSAGRWERAIHAVIELNGHIMRRRGGAPWVRIENRKVDVRLNDAQANLGTSQDLQTEMLHSYYLDPLRRLVHSWRLGGG